MDINKEIQLLTAKYNQELTRLGNQLRLNIAIINRYRISTANKLSLIRDVTNKYNNNVKQLTADYNNKKAVLLQKQSKKALLIGINYRNTPYELYGCINDTKNIQTLLQDKFDYKSFNLLTDDSASKPTKRNIVNELTNLLVNSKTGDNLFFLFSGHGSYMVDTSKDEVDGQDELIFPIDGSNNVNTCIIDDEIRKIIDNNLKSDTNLFMIFDSCFSGSICDLKYNYLVDGKLVDNPRVELTKSNVFVISGCADDQTSADAVVSYNNQNINAGALTFTFLETIRSMGINISLKTLIENMRYLLETNGFQQIPQLSSGRLCDIDKMMLNGGII
jgi:hypothetical protein